MLPPVAMLRKNTTHFTSQHGAEAFSIWRQLVKGTQNLNQTIIINLKNRGFIVVPML